MMCSRAGLSSDDRDLTAQLAQSELEWERLLAEAEAHGVVPLLALNLKDAGDAVPTHVQATLQQRARDVASSNLLLAAEVAKVARTLARAGIECIPYKGPALGMLLYGNLALRKSTDLDFFVKPFDLDRAEQALVAAGYKQRIELGPDERAAFLRAECALDLFDPRSGVRLDLHYGVAPRHMAIGMKVEDLFARASEADFGLGRLRVLRLEDLLLLLCVHGAKHEWRRVTWLADVAQLVHKTPELDWDWLLAESHKLRVRRILLLPLRMAGEYFLVDLPTAVQELCQSDPALSDLQAEVTANWTNRSHSESSARRWRFLLKMREAYGDRARSAWCYATTPTVAEIAGLRLPGFLRWLYSPWHLLRIVAAFLRTRKLAPLPVTKAALNPE